MILKKYRSAWKSTCHWVHPSPSLTSRSFSFGCRFVLHLHEGLKRPEQNHVAPFVRFSPRVDVGDGLISVKLRAFGDCDLLVMAVAESKPGMVRGLDFFVRRFHRPKSLSTRKIGRQARLIRIQAR
jgi:hypothetical protein